jgi:dienelactone hydrolase
MGMRLICGAFVACVITLAPFVRTGAAQSVTQLQALQVPTELVLSADGSELYFRFGPDYWQIATSSDSKAVRSAARPPSAKAGEILKVDGTSRASVVARSPDGTKIAYLDSARPEAALNLFCRCEGERVGSRKLSDLPIRRYKWAADSSSFWVLLSQGADVAFGLLSQDGRFRQMSRGAALRGLGGLAAANDVVAWVQSDSSHYGTIWIKDKAGKVYQLWDANPQTTAWSEAWTQEVVHWKNAHGEVLQGVLARPKGRSRVPLIVDPYSGWQNRFMNVGVLGNYAFVRAGFAVFCPDHRAPFAFPISSFGDAYVGSAKDRDPVEVLTDDVMSGVEELVRRGDVDRSRMFLYSFSTGASAIDQLLTQTTAFRAAVSFAGVSDWLGYYRANQPRGDDTIPNFLGGKRPEDSPGLYDRISPMKHVDRIHTPLLLAIGDKDSIPGGGSRYQDTLAFYDALKKAGRPVELIVYRGQGHAIDNDGVVEQHVNKAIDFFRSHMPAEIK